MPTQEPFELLGVKGLLLPGTDERPCPRTPLLGPLEGVTAEEREFAYFEDNELWNSFAEKAATAACWWKMRSKQTSGSEAIRADDQRWRWQRVFEAACERMR